MALAATHSLKEEKSQSNPATFTVPRVNKKKGVSTTGRHFMERAVCQVFSSVFAKCNS